MLNLFGNVLNSRVLFGVCACALRASVDATHLTSSHQVIHETLWLLKVIFILAEERQP